MAVNLLGELGIIKAMQIKPNFSELQRRYGVDRHTIKKYYIAGGKKRKERKVQMSKYDKHKDEAVSILDETGTNIIGAYAYIKEKYGYDIKEFNYNGFKSYLNRQGIYKRKAKQVHLRYETNPGKQLQVDWKESIKMHNIHGEIYEFNIFAATLGYSRLHQFIYSKNRTTEEFIRCLIDVIHNLGGLPEQILTDNMAAIVSIQNGYKKKHEKVKMFEKDSGIQIKLCKPKSPQTKGKVESSNRFLVRLKAYDGKFKDENELIEMIKKIENDSNIQNNQTTQIPPIEVFKKEKEYLRPITNPLLLDSYIDKVVQQKVDQQLLVRYEGQSYSVPKRYIGKHVKVNAILNELYIYYNKELIATHKISGQKINYKYSHYDEALKQVLDYKNSDEVEQMAKANLKRFERL